MEFGIRKITKQVRKLKVEQAVYTEHDITKTIPPTAKYGSTCALRCWQCGEANILTEDLPKLRAHYFDSAILGDSIFTHFL